MSYITKGFVVALENDLHEDDANRIESAILMLKGVIGVDKNIVDIHDYLNRKQIKTDLANKLYEVLNGN